MLLVAPVLANGLVAERPRPVPHALARVRQQLAVRSARALAVVAAFEHLACLAVFARPAIVAPVIKRRNGPSTLNRRISSLHPEYVSSMVQCV